MTIVISVSCFTDIQQRTVTWVPRRGSTRRHHRKAYANPNDCQAATNGPTQPQN